MRKRRSDQWDKWGFAIAGGIAFLAVVGAYAMRFYREGISNNPEDWSRFGEYIGGVAGTLLALFTLIVLVSTLLVQAAQLVDTRTELQRQSASIAKQNFENTFFRLLGMIEERVSRLNEHSDQANPQKGRLRLVGLVLQLNQRDHHRLQLHATERGPVLQTYRGWHAAATQEIDWYFRLTYRILCAIEQSEVEDRQSYADVLWAALSPAEKHLLFYHGLTQLEHDPIPLTANDFGTLIKRYRMFDTFDRSQVSPIPEVRLTWYNEIPG